MYIFYVRHYADIVLLSTRGTWKSGQACTNFTKVYAECLISNPEKALKKREILIILACPWAYCRSPRINPPAAGRRPTILFQF
jgi:hypothetical protein